MAASCKEDALTAAAVLASNREKVPNPTEGFIVTNEWNLMEKRNVDGRARRSTFEGVLVSSRNQLAVKRGGEKLVSDRLAV